MGCNYNLGGDLACVKYGGDKAYSRRRNLTVQECYAMQSDAVRSDIHLLSYYIAANKQRKIHEAEQGNTYRFKSSFYIISLISFSSCVREMLLLISFPFFFFSLLNISPSMLICQLKVDFFKYEMNSNCSFQLYQ